MLSYIFKNSHSRARLVSLCECSQLKYIYRQWVPLEALYLAFMNLSLNYHCMRMCMWLEYDLWFGCDHCFVPFLHFVNLFIRVYRHHNSKCSSILSCLSVPPLIQPCTWADIYWLTLSWVQPNSWVFYNISILESVNICNKSWRHTCCVYVHM